MKLLLVRHGETIENKEGITQGHLPGRLSELGIAQANKLAERLKSVKIDAIFSSDLDRAKHTAEAIAVYHTNIPLFLVKELREQAKGIQEGRRFGEVDVEVARASFEPLDQVRARAIKILGRALSDFPDKTVLFVAHGTVNKVLLTVLLGKPIEERSSFDGLKNTSVSEFDVNSIGDAELMCLNCTKHLD